ncbi:MAG: diacylglycerol kinase family protein [Hansschlegelia sp.]
MARCLVLLNPRAGTLKDLAHKAGSHESPADLVAGEFEAAGKQVDVRMVPPRDLSSALKEIEHGDDHDEIIVGGGDGSLSRSLGRLLASGKTFGVLPFGTMNLLARDLGVPAEMKEAIAALARSEPRRVDLASVNGRAFHSISGLGFFAQMAQAREAARGLKGLGRFTGFAVAAFRAFFRSGRSRYELVIDGSPRRVDATAVLVTNNAFEGGWRRARLDEGKIEVIVAHAGTLRQRLGLGYDVIRGRWRDNPLIESFRATTAEVDKLRRRRVWVATDGELTRENSPVRYEAMPGAALMLTPITPRGGAAEAPAA